MGASGPHAALKVLTSLRLGDRVTVRSDDGLLAAEYALFDPADIVLRAADPVTVREAGYMTTARDAVQRLARYGVTPALAEECALALSPEVAASYARSAAARTVVGRLRANELFDGAVYRAHEHRYDGAWLDLAALSGALPLANAPVLLQALHLVTALTEVSGQAPVHLSTAGATKDRRPGERTHTRVALDDATAISAALRRLPHNPRPMELEPSEDRRLRRDLLARVRERVTPDATQALRAHLATLETALAPQTMQLGHLGDPGLRAIERQLASGDARGIDDQLDGLERDHGRSPGTRYLRARAALLRGEVAPRNAAEEMSELAQTEQGFHEAALVAARTWLAAGEDGHARYFARQLAEDPAAPESERLIALEILDETTSTMHSNAPPPVTRAGAAGGAGARDFARPKAPLFPSLGDVALPDEIPMMASLPPQAPPAAPPPLPPPPRPASMPEVFTAEVWTPLPGGSPPAEPQPGARLPVAQARPRRVGPITRYEPEFVESLALPLGASESVLGVNELPRTTLQARVAMTRLSRDLARDYRLWYGKAIRCNVLAIDAMQQHLSHRFTGAPITDEGVAWELRRHGAMLSEILARCLGAEWVDIGPSEPGYWAMTAPPQTRLYPIGRVYRFVSLGNRARDLVSYYLDLEARAREG